MPLKHADSMPALKALDEDRSSDDGSHGQAPPMSRTESTACFVDFSDDESETKVKPHTGHKKVLVTGGAGFIGSNVAEYLLERGDDVVIVDEMNDYYDIRIKEGNLAVLRQLCPDRKRLTIYRGDICDENFMLDLFEAERPEWVCHMAARAGVRPSIQDPFVYIHSNIRGTTQLMELSHKFGVKNFVFASSSSVYGGSDSTFFSEDESVDNPVSPYAASKKACELLAYTYHHLYKLNVSALRFFTVYGPRGRPDMAPFKFIDRVSRGMEIQQFGDGSSSRDYTYIDDIVDGVVRAIDRQHKYEVFNLGKGSGTSLREFISLVEKHTGKEAIRRLLPDQAGDVPYTCADVGKAYQLLGYKAKVPFEEGIRRTAEWYRNVYLKTPSISEICPETQANGMGRAPSFAELTRHHGVVASK
uniref:NAD(P)-binding domain-containing protein n=1 Tax=Ditylum brightwellii TaxID=49249 RepID=A0A7S4RAB2_9STRA